MDGASEPAGKKRKLNEPYVWDSAYILRKHQGKPPSLTLHLHPTHFRIDGQEGSFAYDSPMKFVLQHLRRQTVPHEMMEELLQANVAFYDGYLIVEVHNHRSKEGKDKDNHNATNNDGSVRNSMHNYNEHITPSPMVPYPKQAMVEGTPEKKESSSNGDMPAPERPKDKDGPTITTMVLHPTEQSKHQELIVLANTPASDVRNKKRGSDSTTPQSAQPPTPQLSVPPTPITQPSRGPLTQSQKMCLEEGDLYSFQADLLVATEPPLFLEPVDNPQDAQKVLDMLQHPLHQDKPPSPKTRKRTTAEVAADDAQAAEIERRMLIMDERVKPSAAGASGNENQTAAASLGFSRFKTLDMVRQKHEEAERIKKEEEARAAMERKQVEDTQAHQKALLQQRLIAQQQQQQQPNQQNLIMQQQQQQQRQQQHEQLRARAVAVAQQTAMMNNANPGHPQQNAMMQNQQQNFQQANPVSMTQSSPVVRQQTPMMNNSSPMVQQSGFPMAQTSSQGAGSPPRPTSAMLQNPMARQISQQQRGSQNNTPQLPQGTPSMAQAMPNRQMNQTPRMPPGSPATGMPQGTPTSASMSVPNGQMGNQAQFTPEQIAMIQQQRAMSQSQHGGSGQAGSPQNMTPEQIQNIRQMQQMQAQARQQQLMHRQALAQAQASGNPHLVQQVMQQEKQRQMLIQRQQQSMLQQQQQHLAQQQQMQGQAGSPGPIPQPTPQMGHAHPQQHPGQQGNMQDGSQMTPQQMQQAQARANQIQQMRQQQMQRTIFQQHIQPLVQQYGSVQNIPSQVIASLPPQPRTMLTQQMAQMKQNVMRQAQAQAQQQQAQGGGGGGEQVPAAQPNPQYMQQLRQNQAMLAQAQAQASMQSQHGGMNGMQGLTFHMGNNLGGGGQNFNGGQQGGNNDLSQQFAAMQNALNQQNQGGGVGRQGMQ